MSGKQAALRACDYMQRVSAFADDMTTEETQNAINAVEFVFRFVSIILSRCNYVKEERYKNRFQPKTLPSNWLHLPR